MWATLCDEISRHRATQFRLRGKRAISGGCINRAYGLEGDDDSRYFVKTNTSRTVEMFAAEARALEDIVATNTIRVPQPIGYGVVDQTAYLILEYIDFGRRGDSAGMGRLVARLHRHQASRFGWHRNNTIGSSPQINSPESDWITFYREHRLQFQFELARKKGIELDGSRHLLENLDTFFESHAPAPSLLHGDLWGGNAGFAANGDPILFDPATYYGDREADLAMTQLFGGFSADFYRGYNEEWPLDPGYRKRVPLYNLYHILNHANLFGGGYAGQAQAIVNELTRAIQAGGETKKPYQRRR